MAVPGSLPQRVFLLAHEPGKGRVRVGTNLRAMLRAAALADLHLSGHLTDTNGRAVVDGRLPCHDPVLRTVLDEIAGSKPRKWHTWMGRQQRATVHAVRRQLSDGGWVRLQPYRILGLFPATRVTARDPRVRKEIVARVNGALKSPIRRVDPADAALVTIVATGGLHLVLDRRAKRANKRRIQELTDLSGPIGPALRSAMHASSDGGAA